MSFSQEKFPQKYIKQELSKAEKYLNGKNKFDGFEIVLEGTKQVISKYLDIKNLPVDLTSSIEDVITKLETKIKQLSSN